MKIDSFLRLSSIAAQSDINEAVSVKNFAVEACKYLESDTLKNEVASIVFDKSKEFMPYDTGYLINHVVIRNGKIIHEAPYAERLYYGDNFNFRTDKHPLATSQWINWGFIAKSSDIKQEVEECIRKEIEGEISDK